MKETEILAAIRAAAMADSKPKAETNKDFRAMAKEIGEKLKEAQLGYMNAGFTEDQAFELMMNAIKGGN